MKKETKKLIKAIIKPYFLKQIILLLVVIISTLLSLLNPYIMKSIIDHGIPTKEMTVLLKYIGIFIIAFILSQVTSVIQSYISKWIDQHMLYDIRMKLYQNMMNKPISFFRKMEVGEIIARVLHETPNLVGLFINTPLVIVKEAMTFCASFVIMFLINKEVTIFSLCITPFIYITLKFFNPRIRKVEGKSMKVYAHINNTVQEIMSNIKELKYSGEYDYQEKRFSKGMMESVKIAFKALKVKIVVTLLITTIHFLPQVILIGYGSYLIMEERMTIGGLVALASYMGNLFSPIRNLTDLNINLQQSIASFQRYKELLDTYDIEMLREDKMKLPRLCKGISVHDMSYGYVDDHNLFEDFNYHIPIGSRVRILGDNGVGKTTLIDLFCGLLRPDRGYIAYDDLNLGELDMATIKANTGIISQDSKIFSDTVRNNITLGRAIDDERIMKLMEILGFQNERLDLSNVVSSSQLDLSGGQKQKIAILRGLIHEPQLLIFDEIETYLDSDTIKSLMDYINTLDDNRIILFITHRDSTHMRYNMTIDLNNIPLQKAVDLVSS